MSIARTDNRVRVLVMIAAIVLMVGGRESFAQWSPGYSVTQQLNSMFGSIQYGNGAASNAPPAAPDTPAMSTASRGPLARLVRNPEASSGSPPFALTDQQGTIQRYVEPVPEIDLAAHVGQIVVVRHDTGRTLLASQLELPSQPITPLIGEGETTTAAGQLNEVPKLGGVPEFNEMRQADYVDNDDSTVQLLSDESVMTKPASATTLEEFPGPSMMPDVPFPSYPGEMMGPGMPGSYGDGPGCDCGGMDAYPGEPGCVDPCPQCGGFQGLNRTGPGFQGQPKQANLYGGVEFLLLQTHWRTYAGNFSDHYEFSPRFTLGFDGAGYLGSRIRYWRYDDEGAADTGANLRLELNVLDLELTHDLRGPRSALVLAAGARLASVDFSIDGDDADVDAEADLAGLTMAADGGVALCCFQRGQLGWVYGGRLSILTGDCDLTGLPPGFPGGGNDNVLVDELYVGLQYESPNPNWNLHARLAYEMQNWRSDALSQNFVGESITFMGPSLEIGVEF